MDNDKLARTIATIEEEIHLGEHWEEIERSIYMTTLYDILELLKAQQKEIEERTKEAAAYAELLIKLGYEFE